MLHTLVPERSTLHGHFSPSLDPIREIDPGDSIRARTLSASGDGAGFDLRPELDAGHALIGIELIKKTTLKNPEAFTPLGYHLRFCRRPRRGNPCR